MKILYILIIGIIEFYCLVQEFIDNGGMNFKLLKIIMESVILLFILILINYRKEFIDFFKEDPMQKKIEHYFGKNH